MNNPTAVARSFIIYAICVPLAIVLGIFVCNSIWVDDSGNFGLEGYVWPVVVVVVILFLPFILRFHHPLMVLGWNFNMIIFFLPGAPKVWLPLVAISLMISIARRTIDSHFRFIRVPELTKPLIALLIVILITAQATGGIGLRSMGGGVFGGKRYIFLLGAIAGYFAMTAQRIPKERATFYTGLFLLGGITSFLGDVFYFDNSSLQWLYLLFPPNLGATNAVTGITRFGGMYVGSSVVVYFMLAKYGIRNILTGKHPLRFGIFVFFGVASMFGGFRSALITFIMVFAFQFYLEGLHRTKLLPVIVFACLAMAVATVPFANRLPPEIQRALSFLPIPVDPGVRAEAEDSVNWRVEIWKAVLPQVPQYLLLGKGLSMTPQDLDFSFSSLTGTMRETSADQGWAALAGDYHNGPLSILIPFGIWGAAAFLWFLYAGCRVLHRNYKYGDPDLRTINAFLLSAFVARVLLFFFIFGGFYGDMQTFLGYLAMSVCINGGVARPALAPNPAPEPFGARGPSLARRLRPGAAPARSF